MLVFPYRQMEIDNIKKIEIVEIQCFVNFQSQSLKRNSKIINRCMFEAPWQDNKTFTFSLLLYNHEVPFLE